MMFGNNNCQVKIKDVRMGPVDPGIHSSSNETKKEDKTTDGDEKDEDEEDYDKNQTEVTSPHVDDL